MADKQVTVEKIGYEDLNLKTSGVVEATFSRTTSTGGSQTIKQIDATHIQFRSIAKQIEDLVDGGCDVEIKPSKYSISQATNTWSKIEKTQSGDPSSTGYRLYQHPEIYVEPANVVDLTVSHSYEAGTPTFTAAYYAKIHSNMAHRQDNRAIGFLHDLHASGPAYDNATIRTFTVMDYDGGDGTADQHTDMDVITYGASVSGNTPGMMYAFAEGQINVESTATGGGGSSVGHHRVLVHNSAGTWNHYGLIMCVMKDSPAANYNDFRAKDGLLLRGKWQNLMNVESADSAASGGYVFAPKCDFSVCGIDISGATFTAGVPGLRVAADMSIDLDGDSSPNSTKIVYNSADDRIDFYLNGVVEGYIDTNGFVST